MAAVGAKCAARAKPRWKTKNEPKFLSSFKYDLNEITMIALFSDNEKY